MNQNRAPERQYGCYGQPPAYFHRPLPTQGQNVVDGSQSSQDGPPSRPVESGPPSDTFFESGATPSDTVFVSGLPLDVCLEEIEDHFSQIADVKVSSMHDIIKI